MKKRAKILSIFIIFAILLIPIFSTKALIASDTVTKNYVLPLEQTVDLDDTGSLKMTFNSLEAVDQKNCPIKAHITIDDNGKIEKASFCKEERKSFRTNRLIIEFIKSDYTNSWAKFEVITQSFPSLIAPPPTPTSTPALTPTPSTTTSLDLTPTPVITPELDNDLIEVIDIKEVKIFGFIKAKMRIITKMDKDTGEVKSTKKPWWRFLAW